MGLVNNIQEKPNIIGMDTHIQCRFASCKPAIATRLSNAKTH